MRLKGIAVAPGIAIAPAVTLREKQPDLQCRVAAGPKEELARLTDAIEGARTQLIEIQKKVRSRIGEEGANILKAQFLILNDPMLMTPVKQHIEQDRLSAEEAVDRVVRELAEKLAAVKDSYLRARAADIQDVGRRLVNNLTHHPYAEACTGIVVAANLTPSEASLLDPEKVMGIATEEGGATSHAAILVRALNIAAVMGVKGMLGEVRDGDCIVVDGGRGEVLVRPDPATLDSYRHRQAMRRDAQARLSSMKDLPAMTLDGFRMDVAANIGGPREVGEALSAGAESVGLFRTEFLFLHRDAPPSEEEQFAVYGEVLSQMAPRRVIIRTMDFGADKEFPFAKLAPQSNPALGLRGIRLSLQREEIFCTQLRALARAAAFGNLAIMLPMVSGLAEVQQANELLQRTSEDPMGRTLGIMVETPAAALQTEDLAEEVDFFSIGTNDLTQYVLAVDRLNEQVAHLYQPFHPAVLRLIRDVCAAGKRTGKWVGICGEMAGNLLAVPLFLGLGLDELSMSPSSIPQVKDLIRQLRKAEAAQLAGEIVRLGSACEVIARLKAFLRERVDTNVCQIGEDS